jgi:hypothetical protein
VKNGRKLFLSALCALPILFCLNSFLRFFVFLCLLYLVLSLLFHFLFISTPQATLALEMGLVLAHCTICLVGGAVGQALWAFAWVAATFTSLRTVMSSGHVYT